MRTRCAKALVSLLTVAVATVVSVELLVRASGYAEPHLYDPIYMPFAGTPDIPYVHKPNLVRARGRGRSIVSTDSLGLRSPEPGRTYGPKGAAEYRIAFVGDSVTFGEGIRDTEDTFVQVVERVLNERQKAMRVRTFNFGASAYNVRVMTATLEHRMLALDPDLVVMVIAAEDFNLARTPAIDPFGYLSDRVPWLLPPDSPVRKHMRRIHTLYVIRALVRYRNSIGEQIERMGVDGEPASYGAVVEFREIARQHAVPSLVVFAPSSRQRAASHLAAYMRRDGIAVADYSRVREEFTWEEFRAGRYDGHPSAAVHRRFGQKLAEAILRERLTRGSS
jgi:hypothetical protein